MGKEALKVLVVGLGNMGLSHAVAYANNPGFEIVGLVNRSAVALPQVLKSYAIENDFAAALKRHKPDLVSINTYTQTHAELAIAAMRAGAHVFVEKPLAATVEEARQVVEVAHSTGAKLVVGYILRHHPSWREFIRLAREFGGPYVMRMNLNQQSSGVTWETHKRLMEATSPIVDCGVHYVDVMCQICDAKPVEVRAMGVRLSDEIAPDMYNYGHLQVLFADGSRGWYEAAWGPMISDAAFFVKDVMTPHGSVSIVMNEGARSDDMETHTKTATLKVHRAALDAGGKFAHDDEIISMTGEPGHQELCDAEQAFVLRAVTKDIDLTRHMADAVASLNIVLAADLSIRQGRAIEL
ncbi:MAG: Gfo/Idh/MocA family protein [Alphaproteobacteria bacterium]